MDTQKTVVIVGASFGGLAVAKELASLKRDRPNIVLIDKRNYLDFNFGSPRVLFQPDYAKRLVEPLSGLPWMEHCTFIHGAVTSIEKTHVAIDGREDLKYDFCVICTGSSYSNSLGKDTATPTAEERTAQYKQHAEEVRAAKSALVVGGGFTGMEIAAEAKEAGVDSVTMVHSKDFLTNTPEQGKTPLERLKKIGVNVILNAKAEQIEDKTYQVEGQQQTYDIVYKCFGFTMVHAPLVAPLGDVLTPGGAVDVNGSFQVKGYSNIFAVGDAVNVDDDHLAYQALNHGKLVGKAIVKLLSHPDAKLPQWKRNGGFRLAVLVLGPKNVLALVGAKTCITYVPGSMNEQKLRATRKSVGL